MLSIRLSRLGLIFLLVLFKGTLDYSYINYINPVFAYAGFGLQWDWSRYLESWMIFLILAPFLPDRFQKPSDFLQLILFSRSILPMLSLYGMDDYSQAYTYACAGVFLLIEFVRSGRSFALPVSRNGELLAIILALSLIGISMAFYAASGALGKISFELAAVYEHRKELSEMAAGGLINYIQAWTGKILVIFLIVLALLKRKYLLAGALLIFQILLFGITSHKAAAVYPFVILTIFMFRNNRHILLWVIIAQLAILILGVIIYFAYDNMLISSYITRRAFFVPAQINYAFYEFFSENGLIYYSHSVLSSLSAYPYELKPPYLIGAAVFGTDEMGANTGFLGTSYSNFGYLGMLVEALIIGFLFRVVDSFSKGDKPSWFYLSVIIIPFMALLTSSELFASLLTHGIMLSMLLAWLTYKRDPNQPYPKHLKKQ